MRLTKDPWLAFLLVVGGILLLTNLGNGLLWQDEAETAILGRNTLRFGYPKAFDGVNHLNPALPVRDGYAWTYHSWLPMYLVAGSFALFGTNTTSARLPFALLGLASIWLTVLLAKQLTGDLWIVRLTSWMLVTSVPFLLHMRQCRYYAAAVFFSLWVALAYWRFLQKKPWVGLELALALVLLFHADHGVFAPVLLACGVHFLWNRPSPSEIYRGLSVLLIVVAATVPWAIYLQSWQHHRAFLWSEVSHHLQFYFRQVNRFLVPLVFWFFFLILFRPPKKLLFGLPKTSVRAAWRLVGCFLFSGFAFLIFIPEQRHFRYLIFLVPWLFFVQSTFLAWLFRTRWKAGFLLMSVLILTDLIHYSGTSILAAQVPSIRTRLSSPEVKVRSFFLEFLGELTHPYRGPVDGIVEYLQKEAKSGQVVKTPYEDHPIIFYTDLKVEPILQLSDFSRETFPDWIVLRKDWLPGGFFQSLYYRKIQQRYREILLDAPDIPWQNRPDPGYHRFRTDHQAPPVVLLRREP